MVEDEITYSKPRRSSEETIQADSKVATCKVIRNSGNFGLWNPESTALESGIQLMGSGIHATRIQVFGYGIRNSWIWNPESTDMESGIHSMESEIQDSLRLPYMGLQRICNFLTAIIKMSCVSFTRMHLINYHFWQIRPMYCTHFQSKSSNMTVAPFYQNH